MAIQRDERQILTQPSNRLVREFKTNLPSPDMTGVSNFAKVLGEIGEQGMKQAAQTETEQYFQSLEWGKDENGNFVKPQAPESFGSFRREYFNELVNKRYTTEILLDHDNAVAKIYADNKAAGGDPGVALAKAQADMKGRLEGVDPSVRSTVALGMQKNITQFNTQAVAQDAANRERTLITDTVSQIEALSSRMVRAGAVNNTADESLLRNEIEQKRMALVRAGRVMDTPEARALFWNPIETSIKVRRSLNDALNDPNIKSDVFLSETNKLQRLIQGVAADNETAFGFKKSDFDNLPRSTQADLYNELSQISSKYREQYSVSAQMRQVQDLINNVNAGIRNQTLGYSEDVQAIAARTFIDQENKRLTSEGGKELSVNSPEALAYIHKRFGYIPSKLYNPIFMNIETRSPQEVELAANLYATAKALPDSTGANTVNASNQVVTGDQAVFLENYLSSRSRMEPLNAIKQTKETLQAAQDRATGNAIENYVFEEYRKFKGSGFVNKTDFEKDVTSRAGLEWTKMPRNAQTEFIRTVQHYINVTDYKTGVELAAQAFKKEWVVDTTNPMNTRMQFGKYAYVPRKEAFPVPLDGNNEPVLNWSNAYIGSIASKYVEQGQDKDGKPVEGTIRVRDVREPIPISSLRVGETIFFQSTKRSTYDTSVPWYRQENVSPSFQVVYYDPKKTNYPIPLTVKGMSGTLLEIYPHAEAKAQHDKFVEAATAKSARANAVDKWMQTGEVGGTWLTGGAMDVSPMSRKIDAELKEKLPKVSNPTSYDSMGKPITPVPGTTGLGGLGRAGSFVNPLIEGKPPVSVDLFKEPNPDAMISPEIKRIIERNTPQRQSNLGTTGIIALGTNDGTPEAAYNGAIQAIDTAMAKGIDPVIVLPNPTEGNQFKPISDAVRRAAEEKGVRFEVLAYSSTDPLHVDQTAARELASRYPNAVYFGDSNAVRIANSAGIRATNRAISMNGTVVAREGIGSADISKLISGYSGGTQQQAGNMEADARSILDFVARPESGGNYNAILGNAKNQTVKLTDMTLSEVAAFQRDMVTKQGKESGAVGKYQIIGPTLQGLIKEMNLDPAKEKFTPELQDRMAMQLLERRGFAQWKAGKLSDEEFANRVAQEWAGVPVVTGSRAGRSYYAGVGSNKAGVSSAAFLNAIKSARGAG